MKNYRDLPFALQNLVEAELRPKERLVWVARPQPRFFTAASTGVLLFSIPWTMFAAIWTIGAALRGAGAVAWIPVIGVPFILAGVWMLFSPVWAYRKALRTVYAITGERAITIEKGWGTTVCSYSPNDLEQTHVRRHRDGSGDIIISTETPHTPKVVNSSRESTLDETARTLGQERGFFNIAKPNEVEQLLRALAVGKFPQG
jgi:hypothetical protein